MTTTTDLQEYFTITQAAPKLGMKPDALRRLCERLAVTQPNGDVVANLGGFIVSIRFGKRKWLVRFPR